VKEVPSPEPKGRAVKERPAPEPVVDTKKVEALEEQVKQSTQEVFASKRLVKSSQEAWRNAFVNISNMAGLKPTEKGQKALEVLIGAQGKENQSKAAKAKDTAPFQDAIPVFQEWSMEIISAIRGLVNKSQEVKVVEKVKVLEKEVPKPPEAGTGGLEKETEEPPAAGPPDPSPPRSLIPSEVAESHHSEPPPPEDVASLKALSDAGSGGATAIAEAQAAARAATADAAKKQKKVDKLEEECKTQQNEISRLLLTIDELRARIEQIQAIAAETNPEVLEAMGKVLEKAGLQDIIEAKGGSTKARGVFERLYQDAVQRIQRLGLIRERMMMANRAYSNFVNTFVDRSKGPDAVPDLERLSSTAEAALSSMWYHTEFLFRNACEYAITQGVEHSLLRGQTSLQEIIDAASAEADGSSQTTRSLEASPESKRRKQHRGDRLPGRRGGERLGYLGLETGPPRSPRRIRRDKLDDPEPTQFAEYVAQLREARGDTKSDSRGVERKLVKNPDGIDFYPKTMKAATMDRADRSNSLPALPKTRSLIQANADDVEMSRAM